MVRLRSPQPRHPLLSRRQMLQAGSIGLMGLSLADAAGARRAPPPPRAVIYLFLTGVPSQHDTFDMKPDGPTDFRGEFSPISTATPGIQICEHMPLLAQRSRHWSLVRSLSHPNNGHQQATMIMLTGRTLLPPTFRASTPQRTDWPAIASVAGYSTPRRHNIPPAVVLPEKIVHSKQGVFPGQFGGLLGDRHDPWFVEPAPQRHHYHAYSGAFPGYTFNLHKGQASDRDDFVFQAPKLSLPEGILSGRFHSRLALIRHIEHQRRHLEQFAEVASYATARASPRC